MSFFFIIVVILKLLELNLFVTENIEIYNLTPYGCWKECFDVFIFG